VKEVKDRTALLSAGGDDGPDSFAPLSTRQASCALSDLAVDDHESNSLLGKIVRRGDTRRRDEFEVGLSVFAKAVSNVLGFGAQRCALTGFQDLIASFLEPSLEPLRRHALSTVNYTEQCADLLEKAVPETLRNWVQLEEELDVANQMRKAKLHPHVEITHELAVRREVIATEDTVKLLAQDVDQDAGAARLVDAKEGVELGAKAPSPKLIPVLFVASLVDVEANFERQSISKILVGRNKRFTRFVDEFFNLAA